jgi:hypothetical protein
MAYLCLQRKPKFPSQVFYVWLVDLQPICAKYGLGTWLSPNYDIRICLFDMRHSWTKNAFWDVNKKNYVNGVSLFNLPYLITLMAYLCSQWTRNVQMKYFMFHWLIYRLFVLYRGWRRESLQLIVFVYICSTWGIVELKRVLRRE